MRGFAVSRRWLANVAVMVCCAVYAVACRAYAIRPYNYRKTIIAHPFPNTPKNTFDVGKTTLDVGKIMSDVIQTISDLFCTLTNP